MSFRIRGTEIWHPVLSAGPRFPNSDSSRSPWCEAFFCGLVSPSALIPLAGGEILTGNQRPPQKGNVKTTEKWIPANANSLLLNCFGLARSVAKRGGGGGGGARSGMAWKQRRGLNYGGAPLTWEHATAFVRQMVGRYFITRHDKR